MRSIGKKELFWLLLDLALLLAVVLIDGPNILSMLQHVLGVS